MKDPKKELEKRDMAISIALVLLIISLVIAVVLTIKFM